MLDKYKEEYIKYAKYVEEHYVSGSKEYENLRAYLNLISQGIKALEDNLIPLDKVDLQKATIRASFNKLFEKLGDNVNESKIK